VGIVGRLFPIKNHHLFLDAAARIAKQAPETRFVIVGDGALRADLEKMACDLGIGESVLFLGWRQDMARILADLDVLVVSSDNEGTPVSAIEAMASGKPVVATRVGGLPDVITEGRTGYLVPPKDAAALADAVLKLIADAEARARMGQAGRQAACERFAETRLIRDTEALYRQLLAANGHPR
jgi:glycosyltransferase involved in cell wall biosynthesis